MLYFTPDFYDLLLVNINMLMMNGFELCEKILQKDVSIKVCFMTAREVNMDAVREVHSEKYRLLHKKLISTHELIKRVKGELG